MSALGSLDNRILRVPSAPRLDLGTLLSLLTGRRRMCGDLRDRAGPEGARTGDHEARGIVNDPG